MSAETTDVYTCVFCKKSSPSFDLSDGFDYNIACGENFHPSCFVDAQKKQKTHTPKCPECKSVLDESENQMDIEDEEESPAPEAPSTPPAEAPSTPAPELPKTRKWFAPKAPRDPNDETLCAFTCKNGKLCTRKRKVGSFCCTHAALDTHKKSGYYQDTEEYDKMNKVASVVVSAQARLEKRRGDVMEKTNEIVGKYQEVANHRLLNDAKRPRIEAIYKSYQNFLLTGEMNLALPAPSRDSTV